MANQGLRVSRDIELAVVRHGRTAWNADGRFQGQSDVPLDEFGRAQAAHLAAALASDHFDLAIASDLVRASETARIVLGSRSLHIELDPAWREMRFGVWEGLTWPQIVERYPEVGEGHGASPRFFTPEGGESFDDVCARVEGALEELAARVHDGTHVLIVTHAGVLHALLRVALGESEAAALGVKFSPATVTQLRVGPSGGTLVQLNYAPPVSDIAADVPA
jgi:broad specificity phosphatase PhoE